MVYVCPALASFSTRYAHLDATCLVFSFLVQSSKSTEVRIEFLPSLVHMLCVWTLRSILAPAGPTVHISVYPSTWLPYGENAKCMHSASSAMVPLCWTVEKLGYQGWCTGTGQCHCAEPNHCWSVVPFWWHHQTMPPRSSWWEARSADIFSHFYKNTLPLHFSL